MKIISNGKADSIFYNGKIYTQEENDSTVEAIAVQKDKIYAIGTNEEILSLIDKDTFVCNLHGKSIIPGINDAHNHAWETGIMLEGIVLFSLSSIDDLIQKIQEKTNELNTGDWIQGGSWVESQFIENRAPNRFDLDKGSKEHPIVLERIFGGCVVNTKALELAGIDKNTKNPPKGEIEKDNHGNPTGVLWGDAVLLIRKIMPGPFGTDDFGAKTGEPSIEVLEKSILKALNEYAKYGITSITEPGVSKNVAKAYHNLLIKNKNCLIYKSYYSD